MSNYLNHRAPKAHAPKWLQIIAIYAFAMSAAVACSGKFEVAKNEKKETANGTAAVVRDGNTGGAVTGTLAISKVQTVFLPDDEFAAPKWSLKVDFNHGGRALTSDVFPHVNPLYGDTAVTTAGSMNYEVSGICGNELCSKFAVMIEVNDTSNGTRTQVTEYWDLLTNNIAPQKRVSDQVFGSVWSAYESLSGQLLDPAFDP
ncbi:MAG: hypothetical protein IPJ84_15720 [Bdellovibrionales bacterium]|nr:hypothetical protein [Bdellovibrionales bacterium]